ncbi:MAG TPA: S-4TM family putative pore-forming effector [Terriglobales bacterium]|nr:S-4TM family putative pore-forming effector [Terriglobales bacterium]
MGPRLQRSILILAMNDIPDDQNEPIQIERLAAQRYLYSCSKRLLLIQLVLGGPIAIVWSFLVLQYPHLKDVAAAWGFFVFLLNVLLVDGYQKSWQERAAKIQELFDCEVLKLPWNTIKVGSRPIPEEVHENAAKYFQRETSAPALKDWYPTKVGRLPLPVARIICQRTNCWWDARQRKRYAQCIAGVAVVVVGGLFWVAFAAGMTLPNLILKVIAPALPIIGLSVRQWKDQRSAVSRLEALHSHANSLWAQALQGVDDETLTHASRQLQDEIFSSRKFNPPVFDRLYKLLQPESEVEMNRSAADFVDEWQHRNN